MNFTLESQPFLARLNAGLSILKQFSSTEHKVGVSSDGKTSWLACTAPTTRILLSVEDCCAAGAKFAFSINPDVLSGLIGGRKTVEFEIKDNTLSLGSKTKGSNYQGKGILTLPFDDSLKAATALLQQPSTKKQGAGVQLSKVALGHLYKGAELTKLTPFTGEADELLIHVRAIGSKFQISCSDNLHTAYYESGKVDVQDFHVAMRRSYFDIVKKLTGLYDQELKLSFNDSHMVVASPKFYIELPLIQVDSRSFDRVRDLMPMIKSTGLSCSTPRKALDLVIANVYGLYEKGAHLRVTPVEQAKKPTVRFEIQTGHGSISDDLKVESLTVGKKASFSMDPIMLEESLHCFDGPLEFGVSLNPKMYVLRQTLDGAKVVHTGMLV